MVNNTYIPGITTFMKMNNTEKDQRIAILQEEAKNVFTDNEIVKSGISNGCTRNQLYKDLLINLKLSTIEISMICEIY